MNSYVQQGNSWYLERYILQKSAATKWFYAFMGQTLLCVALLIAICCMLPLKQTMPMPIIVNEAEQVVKAIHPKKQQFPINQAMVQNDIVRFVRNRESYDAKTLNYQIRNIAYSAGKDIFAEFEHIVSPQNKNSLLNTLGIDGSIEVKVHDVVFLESKEQPSYLKQLPSNVVQVDFSTTVKSNSQDVKENWVAIISFDYKGTPKDEITAWENWNGFIVTSYRVNRREV